MPKTQLSTPRRLALAASGVIFVALAVLLIDTVIDIWPSVGVQSELCKKAEAMPLAEREPFLKTMRKGYKVNCRFKDVSVTRVNLGGTHTFLSPGQGLFGLVGIFGALGALIRSLREVAWAGIGRSEESASVIWNMLRPVFGATLAIALYVTLRAVFLPSGTIAAANPYGFIAVALVTGMFCSELLCWGIARARSLSGMAK